MAAMEADGQGPAVQLGPGGEPIFDRAFDINEPAFSTDAFRMYEFKVCVLCWAQECRRAGCG